MKLYDVLEKRETVEDAQFSLLFFSDFGRISLIQSITYSQFPLFLLKKNLKSQYGRKGRRRKPCFFLDLSF